jgi:hypothetical protein
VAVLPGDNEAVGTVLFERAEFSKKLSEVGGFLAELRYIDRALTYLGEQEAQWWEGLPQVSSGDFILDVELGETVPFTRRYRFPHDVRLFPWQDPDSRRTEINNHLQELAEEARTWAGDNLESLARMVEPFTWPLASKYENLVIAPLGAAHVTLEDEVSNDFGKLRHSLGNWEGHAAESFATNFYHPFEDTLRSHKQLLAALAGGVVAAKAIAESTQHSLMNAVHYVQKALYEQLELRAQQAEQARQESRQNILIIAGGTATVFGGITGGSLWGIGIAAVEGGTAIASTAIPAATDFTLKGATAEALLDALTDAIGLIDVNDGQQHDQLKAEIDDAIDRVIDLRDRGDDDYGRLIPIRPNIVDGVDGNDFYLPDA